MNKRVLRVSGLRLPLSKLTSSSQEEHLLRELAAKHCGAPVSAVLALDLEKKSLDAREKERPAFLYTVRVTVQGKARGEVASKPPQVDLPTLSLGKHLRPVIIGAGPAGLFAAYALALSGLKPLVLERGFPVEERALTVQDFWTGKGLSLDSNIQFGEGGAGAFSDGKLTSRSKDTLGRFVLETLVEHGAPKDILYWHKPHIGSDVLPQVVAALRRHIEELGGEFRYGCRVTGFLLRQGAIEGVRFLDAAGEQDLPVEYLVLAVGNGAREIYHSLAALDLAMEAKPFAVGLRIAHAQSMLDQGQYGSFAQHPLLGAADYQLTYTDAQTGKGCYTFCNCPGGYIVNASSTANGLVVNGASDRKRNGPWGNSAVVAQVSPGEDFGTDPLAGMHFQEKLEQAAFTLGGGNHYTPCMSIASFFGNSRDMSWDTGCLRTPGSVFRDVRECLPEAITESLQRAISTWNRRIPGFGEEGLLAAVESRTSAPLRILRGEDRQSLNCRGLYPAGEGAGYAGGIVSSALDGFRTALAVLERYSE